ncbi:QacE family quaternary ammonium compound efflux SMR transporter [Microbacterium faecale]|uniref:QacE family quaternary ammonium compound efflux SMR transporter n=1 Tax=Microbacterium faecale TaxID=1804630 RepID=A0A916YI43_9MICO|nr:multidrug efflux SMR transporter [Microbacterium faecale]GGD44237.1 QacE family quaternary ammonium compound efflux SMR transporter [Microbacterium faecale]
MEWIVLIASGLLEAVWATALSASKGFRKLWPSVLFVISLAASMAGLAYAMNAIPTGTAYAVWVGIGAVLTVVLAVFRREERMTILRGALLALLVASVIGLKAVS